MKSARFRLTRFPRPALPVKNGLLPVVVPKDAHAGLFAALEADPNAKVEVSLATQTLTLPSGRKVEFPVDPFARYCMLE